jgi:hypothetical protein
MRVILFLATKLKNMRTLEEILEDIRTTNPMSLNMNKLIKELQKLLNEKKDND